MNLSYRALLLIFASVVLFSCSSKPSFPNKANDKPARQTNSVSQTESKPDALAEYSKTKIETSNGIIEIEPTVVATTDAATQPGTLTQSQINKLEYKDPFESFNRAIFKFNHVAYTYALIPLANGYNAITPEPVKESVSNFFSNLGEPLNLINNGLSGDFNEAGSNLARFLINSTIGIFGLFDPADAWLGIKAKPQNFATTLRRFGVGSGAFVVLPLLGASDLRGTTSVVTESLIHPASQIFDSPDDTYIRAGEGFNDFSNQSELYSTLYEKADDPYVYFRNQYIQARNRDAIAENRLINKEVDNNEQRSDMSEGKNNNE